MMNLLRRIASAPGLRTLLLPGHTPGLTGLAFRWRAQRVVVAADAAMTEEFFRAREGYHNSSDMEQARASIDRLTQEADIIIPGHGKLSNAAELKAYRDMLATVAGRVKALVAQGKKLEEIVAAKPSAEWDEKLGNGFIKTPKFAEMLARPLLKR